MSIPPPPPVQVDTRTLTFELFDFKLSVAPGMKVEHTLIRCTRSTQLYRTILSS